MISLILQYNTIVLSLYDLDLHMASILQSQEAFRNNNFIIELLQQ